MKSLNKIQITVFASFIILVCVGWPCLAIHKYSQYSENYRDTIYIKEPLPKYSVYHLNGTENGIVQHKLKRNGKYIVEIRSNSNSSLKQFYVGKYDYLNISMGDTIISSIIRPIIVHDTVYQIVHIEHHDTGHNAFVLNGAPNGIAVEFIYQDNNGTVVPKSRRICIRPFNNSKIVDFYVGDYDWDRIHKGDTIYGQ